MAGQPHDIEAKFFCFYLNSQYPTRNIQHTSNKNGASLLTPNKAGIEVTIYNNKGKKRF